MKDAAEKQVMVLLVNPACIAARLERLHPHRPCDSDSNPAAGNSGPPIFDVSQPSLVLEVPTSQQPGQWMGLTGCGQRVFSLWKRPAPPSTPQTPQTSLPRTGFGSLVGRPRLGMLGALRSSERACFFFRLRRPGNPITSLTTQSWADHKPR